MSKSFSHRLKAVTLAVAHFASITVANAEPTIQQESLKLKGKNVSVPTLKWIDNAAKPKAVLLAIHGGVQHAGVFKALAEQLAPKGILFYSIDLYGHGAWLEEATKAGIERPKLDYSGSSEDVVVLAQKLREEHSGLPVFCIGESMGASVALHAVNIEPKLFDGLILASPGTSLHVNPDPTPIFESVWNGARTLGQSIDISAHLRHISEDPRINEATLSDPRIRKVQSLKDLIHSAIFVRQNTGLAPKVDPAIPLLVLQGDKDEICSVKSVDVLYKKFQGTDKSMTTFKGKGHLLVTMDHLKPEVVETVTSWIDKHVGAVPIAIEHSKSAAGKTASDP